MPYCFELLAIIGEKNYHFNFGFIIVIGLQFTFRFAKYKIDNFIEKNSNNKTTYSTK